MHINPAQAGYDRGTKRRAMSPNETHTGACRTRKLEKGRELLRDFRHGLHDFHAIVYTELDGFDRAAEAIVRR